MADALPVPTQLPIPPLPTPPLPWWALPGLAFAVLLSLDGVTFAAFYTGDNTLKPVLATGMMTLAGVAVGYFFQSSAGSAKKDDVSAADSAAKSAVLAVSVPISGAVPEPSEAEKALAAKLPA
jgi:hypothetical protein